LPTSFAEAVERTREALAQQGFGVLMSLVIPDGWELELAGFT
jgi:hypothetical protein